MGKQALTEHTQSQQNLPHPINARNHAPDLCYAQALDPFQPEHIHPIIYATQPSLTAYRTPHIVPYTEIKAPNTAKIYLLKLVLALLLLGDSLVQGH